MDNFIKIEDNDKEFHINKIQEHLYNEYEEECTQGMEYITPLLLDYNLLEQDDTEANEAYEKALNAIFMHNMWNACYDEIVEFIEEKANSKQLISLSRLVDVDFPIIEFIYLSLPDDYIFEYDDEFIYLVEQSIEDLIDTFENKVIKKLFEDAVSTDDVDEELEKDLTALFFSVYLEKHSMYVISNVMSDSEETKVNILSIDNKFVSFNLEAAMSCFNHSVEMKLGALDYDAIAFGISSLDNDYIEFLGMYSFDSDKMYVLNNTIDQPVSQYLS